MINKEMNIFTVKEIIEKNKGVDAYKVSSININSYELYYVLNKLETARNVNTTDIHVTIYKDFDDYRGSSSFSVTKAATYNEVEAKVENAVNRSMFVKNKFYELPKPRDYEYKGESNISTETLSSWAFKVADAIFKTDIYKDGWINSSEIFVTKTLVHFLNSNGIDVSYESYKLMIEVIPTWKGEKEEVELYFSSITSEIDLDRITEEVKNKLMDAKERGEAKEVPEGIDKCKVILCSEEAKAIFSFFASELSYNMQYRNMSHFQKDDKIQETSDSCDLLTIDMKSYIKGSTDSSPIDSLGTILKDIRVIEDGKVINYYGDSQYGYLMGIKDITGFLPNVKVQKGSKAFTEMKKEKHLLCLNFSAFQLDDSSGYYGGEVRLALYFDGEKVIPVTGFSVSGNIYEDIKKAKFSKETEVLSGYEGPKYLEVVMNVFK